MKKFISIALAALIFFSLQAQNRPIMNYDQEWKSVAKFEEQSLPKSAAEQVDKILRKAVADKNSPQIIKALIHQGKYDLAVDGENNTAIFQNLQSILEKSTDIVEKSLLHSMLGELYLQYYQMNSWMIDERTEIKGFVPQDIKEWTRNLFYDKVVEHLNASISSRKELENAHVETYTAVVELGKDSRRFYPTMYDFLMLRAIDFYGQIEDNSDLSRSLAAKNISPEDLFVPANDYVKLNINPQPTDYNLWSFETYKKYLISLIDRNMSQSLLLTDLKRIGALSKLRNTYNANVLPLLKNMLEDWKEEPISAEIVEEIADFYDDDTLFTDDNLKEEEKSKELYELLMNTIRKFPNYERISVLENRIARLIQPEFSFSGKNAFSAKGEKKLSVSYKNIKSIKARLYKLPSSTIPYFDRYNNSDYPEEKKTFVKEFSFTLPGREPYLEGKTDIELDINDFGIYKLEFDYPEKDKSNRYREGNYYFVVSDLATFARSSGENRYEFFVVNRESGKPVKGAKVNIYRRKYRLGNYQCDLIKTIYTNEKGLAEEVINDKSGNLLYNASLDNGSQLFLTQLPYSRNYSSSETKVIERTNIYTDRSLYRPGQTVFFKAIATITDNDKSTISDNKPLDFILRDTNWQEVSKQTLRTNEFGSVSGEFVLPQGVLSGNFSISTENGNIYFRVEEYKRPTFEVSFDKIEKTYKFGEEIVLTGKAENYSGVKLQNATVNYQITRQQTSWWRWGGESEHFAEGITTTDENGKFNIAFTPQKADDGFSAYGIYTFSVEAVVTDMNGETQVGNYSVTVGDVSMVLNMVIPDKFEKSSAEKVIISARNLDGNEIKTTGSYTVFSLHDNDSINTQVLNGNFETGEQKELKEQLKKFTSGKYRITLQAKDDRDNSIEEKKDFILFSYSDKRPPIKTNEWLVVKNKMFSSDKPAEIILGSTDNINVLYELWNGNTILKREWIKINNENRLFTIPFKPEYKNGLTVMMTYVKDEKFYCHSTDINFEKEKKELEIKLDVFRDKIRPGANEEWRLTIKDNRGNSVLAEVLAGMFDFSLDQIYQAPKWILNLPYLESYKKAFLLQSDNSFQTRWVSEYIPMSLKNEASFIFDRFNWFDFSFYSYGNYMIRGARSSSKAQPEMAYDEMFADSGDTLDEVVVVSYHTNGVAVEALPGGGMKFDNESSFTPPLPPPYATDESPQIRRNFNETAFFFPQLRTNEKGETQIAFTVPESNTRWRFRVLAHDKNLNSGYAEAFAQSQKELMVTPNMPRFLRHGDRTSISTKISNLSEEAVSGNVKLEFFNPVTDEIINTISVENQSQPFSLKKEESSDAKWVFDVPANIDIIGVRIVAQSESFSDGEQHTLVVLPNRMLVTESMRMDVNGTQTKEFTMDRLANRTSETIEDYRLTLEFTSNPAWYAVQALPVLSNPDSDNAISWFASYYANTLGMHISKAYPKVSAMIEAWKKQGGDSETLVSNLEKNQELKNVLLEETPWVLEAKDESEQKQKLSLLFDLNRNQNLTRQAIDKLAELQTSSGGWSWFKGFYPSRSITQYILYGFNQLKELKAVEFTDDIIAMQTKAVSYIDAEAVRNFEELKKYNKNWRKIESISVFELEYLYVRSSYNQPMDAKTKEMVDFYTSVVEKNWTRFDLYGRSLIAVLMHRNGKENIVQNILKSYREHATVSEEMGMFWANNRARVFMSQSATSVHTFIMNAFRIGGARANEMDNMKRWLLKQKQTQLWESTHATMDAVYALLSTGSDWFSSENKTTVTVADKRIEPEKQELGTGYFKESWHKSEIVPQMGKVKIENSGNAPAWGALYWQYYEDLDKISKTDASLDVEKLLFVEKTDASGTKLNPITEDSPLKVGDKVVVRLTVRADRDFEFVHLKDMRAASFEPIQTHGGALSGVKWQGGTIYYQTSKDASTNFYFDVLPRGTYVFEYAVFVNRTGDYSNGITTIQCMYAPEFTSHTAGIRVKVEE